MKTPIRCERCGGSRLISLALTRGDGSIICRIRGRCWSRAGDSELLRAPFQSVSHHVSYPQVGSRHEEPSCAVLTGIDDGVTKFNMEDVTCGLCQALDGAHDGDPLSLFQLRDYGYAVST